MMKWTSLIEITLFYLFFLSGEIYQSFSASPPETSIREAGVEDINCLKYNYQIHDALTSIFPSEGLSSKLINIWVHQEYKLFS